MIRNLTLLFVFSILVLSCDQKLENADVIIGKSIAASGGALVAHSNIEFDFRDKHYKAIRNDGLFQYERAFNDSLDVIKDVLNNEGLQRFRNNSLIELSSKRKAAYSASVNSVHYFSVLPYGLDIAAVNKTFLGISEIKGQSYYKIKVTFNQEGGGEDFEDVFVYWVEKKTFKIGYLAYSYNESDGIGYRFRESYNERFINGIRFVDYNNYKPESEMKDFLKIDRLFQENKLKLLSKIELKSLRVDLIDN